MKKYYIAYEQRGFAGALALHKVGKEEYNEEEEAYNEILRLLKKGDHYERGLTYHIIRTFSNK